MTNILDIMAIPLSQGLYALVDGADYQWLNKHNWFASIKGNTIYAQRKILINNKRRTVGMHRAIMAKYGFGAIGYDHKNGCGLDNRKRNLRPATNSQNQHNQKINKKRGGSKYKGVHWHKTSQKWQAGIKYKGQDIYIGLFNNEDVAGKAYDNKAKELFGEFANLNF